VEGDDFLFGEAAMLRDEGQIRTILTAVAHGDLDHARRVRATRLRNFGDRQKLFAEVGE
jgi:hypothetical protein